MQPETPKRRWENKDPFFRFDLGCWIGCSLPIVSMRDNLWGKLYLSYAMQINLLVWDTQQYLYFLWDFIKIFM